MRRASTVLALATVLVAACDGREEPPENHPPLAVDDAATGDEDTVITVDVLANDRDPDGDRLRLVTGLADGHLVREVDGRLAVTPAANFHGEIDVSYRLSDGLARTDGRLRVTVRPVNDAPTANDDLVATGANTATTVVLTGADLDGDALAFEVVDAPAHGALGGTPPDLTYTPSQNYVGSDAITFRARDASAASEVAIIAIDVVAGSRPVAEGQTLWTLEDTAKPVALVATDADGDALTYAITEPPQHGTLSGTAPNLTYTPVTNYTGADTFRWTASDGVLTSPVATVHIEISATNDPPVAHAQSVVTAEDMARGILLVGHDPENTPLTFTVVDGPAHGTLGGGTGAMRTYTPAANYHGADAFTFTVSDGFLTSEPATVSIGVDSVPDVPVATAQLVAATEDTTRTITLAGTDGDGDDVVFALVTWPQHGTLLGAPPQLTYIPDGHYNGPDSFAFRVADHDHQSQPAIVNITVAAVDDPPHLAGRIFSGDEDAAIAIPLPAMDLDGEPLTYAVTTPPIHGTIAGTGAALTYRAVNYDGPDTFALTATDGHTTTAPAIFTVNVQPMPDAPVAHDDIGIVTGGRPLELSVLFNDEEVDGEILWIESVSTPTSGTVVHDSEVILFTPAPGSTAPVTFTYTIVDPDGLSSTATVRIGIGEFPPGVPLQAVGKVVSTSLPFANGQLDVSRDGRFVAFATAEAIDVDDTNADLDIYVWDRVTGGRWWISRRPDGGPADGASFQPSISGDGRYVAFSSSSTNLVGADTNGAQDVFVHDRISGTTVRASVSSSGGQGTGSSALPRLSDDGTVVAFSSSAFDLIALDANGVADIFVRDLAAGTTSRVSARTGGGEADRSSSAPALSRDGKVVAFVSAATNLVNGDANNLGDVFVHDRTTGVTERVSVSSVGVEANGASLTPAISHDGRFVAFRTQATNLIPQGSSGTYVRDRFSPSTIAAGAFGNSVAMSADSRYVIGHMLDGTCFVRDRFTSTTQNLPPKLWYPVISPDGRYITGASEQGPVPGVPAGAVGYVLPNPL